MSLCQISNPSDMRSYLPIIISVSCWLLTLSCIILWDFMDVKPYSINQSISQLIIKSPDSSQNLLSLPCPLNDVSLYYIFLVEYLIITFFQRAQIQCNICAIKEDCPIHTERCLTTKSWKRTNILSWCPTAAWKCPTVNNSCRTSVLS